MSAGQQQSPGEQLDELNKATFRKHHRNIADRGLAGNDRSALPALLADLRANAETVYGVAPRGARAKGRSDAES